MNNTTPITISDLKFIKPTDLASLLKSDSSRVSVIDVRDDDYIGGHVAGNQHVPVNQLDARMPELLRLNMNKDKVVFHCMLSQQRGPKSALRYARARLDDDQKQRKEEDSASEYGKQEICVLEGGFVEWQKLYGKDEMLTEGYVPELWE